MRFRAMGRRPHLALLAEVLALFMNEKQLADEGRRTAETAKETAREWTERAKGTAQEWTERARSKARDAGAAADDYVRDNPWMSVAVVAAVACVLGYILGRSSES